MGGTPYNNLYGEARPEMGTFFGLQVYERVGISLVEVYERVEKSVSSVGKKVQKSFQVRQKRVYERILSKMVYKRVSGWTSGRSPLYKTLLIVSTPRITGSTCAHDFACNNYRLSSAEFSPRNVTK